MISKMKAIKEDVKNLLENYPMYRDNDSKLISAYYYRTYGGNPVFSKMTALEFLMKLASGEYIYPDTITRVRRKLQEQYPELRGSKYYKRHQDEKDVRHTIDNL